MKPCQLITLPALLALEALAFPSGTPESVKSQVLDTIQERANSPTFNAELQRVSITGKHKFVAPDLDGGDQRGPCPGLNALANHGYLPHSGVVTIEDIGFGTVKGVGLGADIAQIFGAFGAFSAGDGIKWSIGGPPCNGTLSDAFPGFFGKPTGISFSHNTYEGDGSAGRPDLYVAGNDYKLDMSYFKMIYESLGKKGASNLRQMSQHRGNRVQQSIETNPYFFQAPFSGVGVVGAANSFVYRLFANKSEEYPQGLLTREVLMAWYGVVKDKNGNLKKIPGHERIPENWYKRSLEDQYTVPAALKDIGVYGLEHPNTIKVGGNTGKVNTFTGVDVSDLTGGVFNSETLLEGNNLGCFIFQAAAAGAGAAFLSKGFANVEKALSALRLPIDKHVTGPLGCPKLEKLNQKALEKFPGNTNLHNGHYPGQEGPKCHPAGART